MAISTQQDHECQFTFPQEWEGRDLTRPLERVAERICKRSGFVVHEVKTRYCNLGQDGRLCLGIEYTLRPPDGWPTGEKRKAAEDRLLRIMCEEFEGVFGAPMRLELVSP